MLRAIAAPLVLLAGCSKDPRSPAADCNTVVPAAVVRVARAGMEEGVTRSGAGGAKADPKLRAEMDRIGKDLDVQFKPVADALAAVCVSDHWSPEMLACLREAKDGGAFDACNSHLDATQRKHLDDAAHGAQAHSQQGASPTCMKYADFEIKCAAAGEDARSTILDFCAKARAGAKEITYQLIALESSCADTATDCESYKSCVEKKKSETSPTP